MAGPCFKFRECTLISSIQATILKLLHPYTWSVVDGVLPHSMMSAWMFSRWTPCSEFNLHWIIFCVVQVTCMCSYTIDVIGGKAKTSHNILSNNHNYYGSCLTTCSCNSQLYKNISLSYKTKLAVSVHNIIMYVGMCIDANACLHAWK